MHAIGKPLSCSSNAPSSTPPPHVTPWREVRPGPNTALQETAERQSLACALKTAGKQDRTPVTGVCFEDGRRTGPISSFPCLPGSYPLLLVFKMQRMGGTHTYIWFTLLHASVHVEKSLSWKKHPRDSGPGAGLIKPWVVSHPL